MRIAITRWKWDKNQKLKEEGDKAIVLKSEKLAILKEKMVKLELDNATLSDENNQLRVFTEEGFEIAKTMKVMSEEKDLLLQQLADQDAIIS